MENYKKIKLKLKEDINPEDYPELFERREETIKITLKHNFIKKMLLPVYIKNKIINKLGKTYVAYLWIIVDYINYDNEISFHKIIKDDIISKTMLNNKVKPKLKEAGLVKKLDNVYILNPIIATKSEKLNPDIVNLFKEDNNNIYNIKL